MGPGIQTRSVHEGYNQKMEDDLLAGIAWPADGSELQNRLFWQSLSGTVADTTVTVGRGIASTTGVNSLLPRFPMNAHICRLCIDHVRMGLAGRQ